MKVGIIIYSKTGVFARLEMQQNGIKKSAPRQQ
jgi:hypothetical protein